jgi:hypothetical protein
MDIEFQEDKGYRKLPCKGFEVSTGDVQLNMTGFYEDTGFINRISREQKESIQSVLLDGWKLKDYRRGSVVSNVHVRRFTKYPNLGLGGSDLPTSELISGVWGVTKTSASTIIKSLKKILGLYTVNPIKRRERGDFLQKYQKMVLKERVTQKSLAVFFDGEITEKRTKRLVRKPRV